MNSQKENLWKAGRIKFIFCFYFYFHLVAFSLWLGRQKRLYWWPLAEKTTKILAVGKEKAFFITYFLSFMVHETNAISFQSKTTMELNNFITVVYYREYFHPFLFFLFLQLFHSNSQQQRFQSEPFTDVGVDDRAIESYLNNSSSDDRSFIYRSLF